MLITNESKLVKVEVDDYRISDVRYLALIYDGWSVAQINTSTGEISLAALTPAMVKELMSKGVQIKQTWRTNDDGTSFPKHHILMKK